ncbi:hypothetical protein TNCV_3146391 [Trichonephila clavipes]|nr:hypothetical protein TNCV_3146391 [Trichonephila clavipes]
MGLTDFRQGRAGREEGRFTLWGKYSPEFRLSIVPAASSAAGTSRWGELNPHHSPGVASPLATITVILRALRPEVSNHGWPATSAYECVEICVLTDVTRVPVSSRHAAGYGSRGRRITSSCN